MKRANHSVQSPWKFIRAATKQLRHIGELKIRWARAYRHRPTRTPVYFHPSGPHPYTVCYRTLHRLGVPIHSGRPPAGHKGIVFLWHDDTFVNILDVPTPHPAQLVVNRRCLDISKERVEAVHQRVLGYGMAVDPLVFSGRMVVKSNQNGTHDGQVVEGPVQQRSRDCVYQRVLDNSPANVPVALLGHEVVCDFRVPVLGKLAAFSYIKFRPVGSRFSNTNCHVDIVETAALFSPEEMRAIEKFSEVFGLDYGEIDIVRDRHDGRIYLLDVNKTPLGPPNGLSPEAHQRALTNYQALFADWFSSADALTHDVQN